VASDKTNFFVIWQDQRRNGLETDIYGTKVPNSGPVTDTNGVPIQTNASPGWLAWAGSPQYYLVVFPVSGGTYGRRLTATLSFVDTDKFLINSTHQPLAITSSVTNFLVLVTEPSIGMRGVRVRGSDGAVLDQTPIVITMQGGGAPSPASDGKDFLVVWEVSGEQDDDGNIFGARVSADGVPLDWFPVSTFEAEDDAQRFPAVASKYGSAYFAVWEDDRGISTNGTDIYGTRLTVDGIPIDFYGIPICTTNGNQERPAVCLGASGGAPPWFVVWSDTRSGGLDIYGARISGDTLVETNGFAISTAANSQSVPSVVSLLDAFLVTWMDSRNGPLDIYGARVSSSGTLLDSSGFAINNQTNAQRNPRVTGMNDMYFVVYFTAQRAGTLDYDIFGTRVTTNGTVLDASGIAICTATNNQDFPSVANDGADFLAVWSDRRESTNWNVYAARIQTNGTVLDANGFLVSNQLADEQFPYVANSGVSGSPYLAVWRHSANNGDVYGAFVTNNAAVSSIFGIDADATTLQGDPQVAANGTTFMTVYTSRRLGTPQRIRARLITP
jgi:hypothetical protein